VAHSLNNAVFKMFLLLPAKLQYQQMNDKIKLSIF